MSPAPVIRTVLVDDQVLYRDALRTLFEMDPQMQVVGDAGSGEEAVEMCANLAPDVVLMDLRMPGMSGVDATKRILSQQPNTKVLVLTTFDEEELVFSALRAGASGYLLKDQPTAELTSAIKAVAAGGTYLQPAMLGSVVTEFKRLSELAGDPSNLQQLTRALSNREMDIVRLLTRGMSNKEIAAQLSVTEGTVKNHMTSILEKFEAPDRTTVALKARDMGIR